MIRDRLAHDGVDVTVVLEYISSFEDDQVIVGLVLFDFRSEIIFELM